MLIVTVRCIGCKAKKDIDEAEAARISASTSVPMCDKCYMPMVAERARR